MQLSDFDIGKQYRAKKVDFCPPDGSPVVAGEVLCFTVLEQANARNSSIHDGDTLKPPGSVEVTAWAEFIRVLNHKSGRIHLLHPSTLEDAAQVNVEAQPS